MHARLTMRSRLAATPLAITGTLPDGEEGVAYVGALTIVGGIPPYSGATIIAGTLPDGITLDGITGDQIEFGGTPT